MSLVTGVTLLPADEDRIARAEAKAREARQRAERADEEADDLENTVAALRRDAESRAAKRNPEGEAAAKKVRDWLDRESIFGRVSAVERDVVERLARDLEARA